MSRGLSFDREPAGYEAARPPYPDALYDRLREHGVLRAGARVLEIGAGTGQATAALVAAGAQVVAVEPGPALAARLAARFPGVEVRRGTLEETDLEPGGYDAAVAATSFHWVDAAQALPRLHEALRPGGLLAVFRQVFGDPDVPLTPFRERVAEVAGARPEPDRRPDPLDLEREMATLTDGGWFEPVDMVSLRWSVDLTAAQVRGLFSTFSDWSPGEVAQVAARAEELGGVVTEHYRTVLWLCRVSSRRSRGTPREQRPGSRP